MHEQESNFEKLKVLFGRMKKVICRFEKFIGTDLKDCPSYTQLLESKES